MWFYPFNGGESIDFWMVHTVFAGLLPWIRFNVTCWNHCIQVPRRTTCSQDVIPQARSFKASSGAFREVKHNSRMHASHEICVFNASRPAPIPSNPSHFAWIAGALTDGPPRPRDFATGLEIWSGGPKVTYYANLPFLHMLLDTWYMLYIMCTGSLRSCTIWVCG